MARRIARIALVAVIMVGVVAMHSWGHRGHADETESASVAAMAHHDHAGFGHHAPAEADPDAEEDPSGLLSLLGFMVCGVVLVRVVLAFLQPLLSRLLAALPALLQEMRPVRCSFRPPPLRWSPMSLQVNRIAVLRI